MTIPVIDNNRGNGHLVDTILRHKNSEVRSMPKGAGAL